MSGSKPLFVDFWATWCGPCIVMEPIVDRLAEKYSDRMVFGEVNVDEEINISSKYQVFSIPTFMVFKGGNPLDAVIGAVAQGTLERLVTNTIDGGSSPAPWFTLVPSVRNMSASSK